MRRVAGRVPRDQIGVAALERHLPALHEPLEEGEAVGVRTPVRGGVLRGRLALHPPVRGAVQLAHDARGAAARAAARPARR